MKAKSAHHPDNDGDHDGDLANAYRAWVTQRAGELPVFPALASELEAAPPSPAAPAKLITFPRLIRALTIAAAAVLVVSVPVMVQRNQHPPAAAAPDSELAMPWPSDTDFLLNWADASPSEFDLSRYQFPVPHQTP